MRRCAFVLLMCLCMAGVVSAQTVVVDAPAGPIRGVTGDAVNSFLGVPYAVPPVGSLRWAAPEMAPVSTETIDATSFKPGCMQRCNLPPHTCPETISEDCLYVNIFQPATAKAGDDLPVMAFMPGGRFEQGSIATELYNGDFFANSTETILVTIAYRLGAFGYLANDDNIAGNYGLQDQLLALEWIQNNIASFGGNTSNVMLFGQSAGGTSTSTILTLTSVDTSKLFHKANVISNPWSLVLKDPHQARDTAKHFADAVGCDVEDLSCLRGVSADAVLNGEIAAQQKIDYLEFLTAFYPWTPVVDGTLVTAQPIEALAKGEMRKVPVIIGSMYNDALLFIYQAWNKTLPKWEYEALVLDVFHEDADQILKAYPPSDTSDNRPIISHMVTQFMFACPARAAARAYAKAGMPTYLYQFDHIISWDVWGPLYPYCVGKVCHGSGLPFIFHSAGQYFNKQEAQLSYDMANYWASFAHHSDPGSAWPQWNDQSMQNMHFATPVSTVQSNLWGSECDLWDKLGYIFE